MEKPFVDMGRMDNAMSAVRTAADTVTRRTNEIVRSGRVASVTSAQPATSDWSNAPLLNIMQNENRSYAIHQQRDDVISGRRLW